MFSVDGINVQCRRYFKIFETYLNRRRIIISLKFYIGTCILFYVNYSFFSIFLDFGPVSLVPILLLLTIVISSSEVIKAFSKWASDDGVGVGGAEPGQRPGYRGRGEPDRGCGQ